MLFLYILFSWDDADFFCVPAVAVKLHFLGLAVVHDTGNSGVERVVGTAAHVLTGNHLGTALTDDDLTGASGLTVGDFNA